MHFLIKRRKAMFNLTRTHIALGILTIGLCVGIGLAFKKVDKEVDVFKLHLGTHFLYDWSGSVGEDD